MSRLWRYLTANDQPIDYIPLCLAFKNEEIARNPASDTRSSVSSTRHCETLGGSYCDRLFERLFYLWQLDDRIDSSKSNTTHYTRFSSRDALAIEHSLSLSPSTRVRDSSARLHPARLQSFGRWLNDDPAGTNVRWQDARTAEGLALLRGFTPRAKPRGENIRFTIANPPVGLTRSTLGRGSPMTEPIFPRSGCPAVKPRLPPGFVPLQSIVVG